MKQLHLDILIDCSLAAVSCKQLRIKHNSTLSLVRSAITTLAQRDYIEVYDIVDDVYMYTSTTLGDNYLIDCRDRLNNWHKELCKCHA